MTTSDNISFIVRVPERTHVKYFRGWFRKYFSNEEAVILLLLVVGSFLHCAIWAPCSRHFWPVLLLPTFCRDGLLGWVGLHLGRSWSSFWYLSD